jgi:hypothetical protein
LLAVYLECYIRRRSTTTLSATSHKVTASLPLAPFLEKNGHESSVAGRFLMHCTIRTFSPYESFRKQQIFAQSVLRKESRKRSYSFKTPPVLPSTLQETPRGIPAKLEVRMDSLLPPGGLLHPNNMPVSPGDSGLPVMRPKHFMALEHPRSDRREPQCSGVGNYAPRISKRLIKRFSIRNT